MTDRQKGFIFAITSALIYGCMPLGAKFVYADGVNPVSLVFFRSLLSIPILYVLMQKEKKIPMTKKLFFHIFLLTTIGASITQLLLFSSYNYISTGLATTIHFVYPVFVLTGSVILFHDKFSWIKLICVLLSIIGIFLFYTPGENNTLFGIFLAFISGITYAFYILCMDKTEIKTMPPFQLCFYIATIGAFILFLYAVFTDNLVYKFQFHTWIALFIFSIFITVFAVVFFQSAVQKIGGQNSSILSTFEPITSIILGILVFNEVLTIKVIVGIILILAAVVILTLFDKNYYSNEKLN